LEQIAADNAVRDARPTAVRFMVLAFLGTAMASAYLTRIINAAGTTIARDFELSNTQLGYILGGFAIGYLWFQVPGGWFGSHFGPRVALPLMSVLWSGCAAWTALARTEEGLWWSRVALGLFQGGLIPTSAKVVADWFPVARRGMASAVVAASMQGGALAASGLTAVLLVSVGWRNIFLAYSIVGVVWAAAFYAFFRNQPGEHPWTNQAERDLIAHGRALVPKAVDGIGRSPARHNMTAVLTSFLALLFAMLASGSMWAMCLQGFCRAFGYEFFISWFPAYLENARQVKVAQAGLLTMAPLLGVALGSLTGGVIVDGLHAATGSKWISRSLTAAIAMSLSGLCTLAAAWAQGPWSLVAVISVGSFVASIAAPATWAAIIDISGRHTAVVTGVMNMIGNLGSATCAVALGFLFDYIQRSAASWNLVLYVFVAVYLCGAVFWLLLDPDRSAVERRSLPSP
jgi:MFS family permease